MTSINTPEVSESSIPNSKCKSVPGNCKCKYPMQHILLAFSLEICFFQVYLNDAKGQRSTVILAQKGGQTSGHRQIEFSIPAQNFTFVLGQSLAIVESD